MRTHEPIVTVITPTTGKNSLFNLIDSIKAQGVPVCHIILWDEIRQDNFLRGKDINSIAQEGDWEKRNYLLNNIEIKSKTVSGIAPGSALRAIGLMAAQTDLVTFADDDIIWEEDHLISLIEAINEKQWAFTKRKIWSKISKDEFEYLGVDEFESVGEDAKTDYKMVDNNCMMFNRRFGTSAACLYRETKNYNDDRLMYAFLKKHAGIAGKTNKATINQVCPKRLYQFFKQNCTL